MLIRNADDFIIGCEREDNARRIMQVLPLRFAKYGLEINAEKTTMVRFVRPRWNSPLDGTGQKPGTFAFLGFVVYWARHWPPPQLIAAWRTPMATLAGWASGMVETKCLGREWRERLAGIRLVACEGGRREHRARASVCCARPAASDRGWPAARTGRCPH